MIHFRKHPADHASRLPLAHGYTLIEMMVVMTIVVTAVGIIFSMGKALLETMEADTARNTVSVAAANIRVYATRDRSVLFDASSSSGSNQGSAILFTPSGDIVLMEHDPEIVYSVTHTTLVPSDYGFKRINELDPIQLAPRYGAVGILRNSNAKPYFVSPPFAITFNASGVQSLLNEYIYVDAEAPVSGNSTVVTTSSRISYLASLSSFIPTTTDYNSDDWNPNVPVDPNPIPFYAEDPSTPDTFAPKTFRLPFEKIEVVQGLMVFNMDDFRAATNSTGTPLTLLVNPTGDYPINTAARDWILENGTPLFFSRYTGNVLVGSDSTEMN